MALSENDIRRRIREIDAAISELNAERNALVNLMYSALAHNRADEIHDKRSVKRVYHEEKIRLSLQTKPRGMKLAELSSHLGKQGLFLKDGTLRSHLSRMKKRGLVTHDRSTHRWRIIV